MKISARFSTRFSTFGCLLVLSTWAVRAASPPGATAFEGMDTSITPGDDFYGYTNGGWLASVQIPADRASYGVDEQLADLNEKRIAELIREAGNANPSVGSDARKVADYYASFMDEAAIEARGVSVVKPLLERIDRIADRAALARFLGGTLRADVDILNNTKLYTDNLFGLWVAQDLDDPSRYLPFLVQGGLGMPDRDYYLKDSPDMSADRSHYQGYIAAILKLAGEADADRRRARFLDSSTRSHRSM
jgi:putative endopeptidase